jgi:hypothetical protein
MTAAAAGCWYTLQSSSPDGTAAIACIELAAASAPELDAALERIGCGRFLPGDARPCDIAGIDRAFVVRWSSLRATVMPHAGPVVVAALLDHLQQQGLAERPPVHWRAASENACELSGSELCQRHLHAAVAAAASPLAVDLLLDQPRRWAEYDRTGARWQDDAEVLARSSHLSRLLTEPVVAVVGRPNIGKSTLLNAMAGRCVAIVRDEAGTTRDHVGVSLVLGDGLAVRWLDMPGITPPNQGPDYAAGMLAGQGAVLARSVLAGASLILLCGDAELPPPELGEVLPDYAAGETPPQPSPEVLRVALRTDRGAPAWPHDVGVGGLGSKGPDGTSAAVGLTGLVERVSDVLLPPRVRQYAGPWAFWVTP